MFPWRHTFPKRCLGPGLHAIARDDALPTQDFTLADAEKMLGFGEGP